MKGILALDLGTKTGWAFRSQAGIISAGTWVLQKPEETAQAAKLRRDRTCDMRIPALMRHLKYFWDARRTDDIPCPIDFLVFEDVQFASTTLQAHLWASLRAAVWLFCHNYSIPRDCCPVGTLKKHGTGHGNAPKVMMIEAAKIKFPDMDLEWDDNIADALFLLDWAILLTKRK